MRNSLFVIKYWRCTVLGEHLGRVSTAVSEVLVLDTLEDKLYYSRYHQYDCSMTRASVRLALSWTLRILFSLGHRLIYWKRYKRIYSANVALITYPRYLSLSRIFLCEIFYYIKSSLENSNTEPLFVFHPYSARSDTFLNHNAIYIEYLILNPRTFSSILAQFFRTSLFLNSKIKKSLFDIVVEQTWHSFFSKSSTSYFIGNGLQGKMAKVAHVNGKIVFEVDHGISPVGLAASYNQFPLEERADYYLVWHEHYLRHYQLDDQPAAILLGFPQKGRDPNISKNCGRVLIGLTYDAKPLWDPWGLLTEEIKFAIDECIRLGYQVQLRLHPFLMQDVSIGPKNKPAFDSIKSFLENSFPNVTGLSHPNIISIYEDIDNSDLVIAQGTLAFNAVARGTPAVVFSKLDNSPDLPLEFFESGAVTTASFYDFEQKCRSSIGGKLDLKFSGLMDNFLCHLKP